VPLFGTKHWIAEESANKIKQSLFGFGYDARFGYINYCTPNWFSIWASSPYLKRKCVKL